MINLVLVILFLFVSPLYCEVLTKDLKTNFTQTRYIKSTDVELISSGTMEIIGAKKIEWKQTHPFPSLIVLTQDSMYTRKNNELVKVKNPGAEFMLSLIFPILSGDLSKAYEKFDVTKKGGVYTLIPLDSAMKKFIKKIEIKTSSYVESFELFEVSGNYLKLNFKLEK